VLVFLNSFLLLNDGNRLAVFAMHSSDRRAPGALDQAHCVVASCAGSLQPRCTHRSHLLYLSPSLLGEARRRQAPGASSSPAQSVLQRLRLLVADDERRAGAPPDALLADLGWA